MEVESRLAALEGTGIGATLGDLGGREEAVETELERVVERVKRVDASEGAREDDFEGIRRAGAELLADICFRQDISERRIQSGTTKHNLNLRLRRPFVALKFDYDEGPLELSSPGITSLAAHYFRRQCQQAFNPLFCFQNLIYRFQIITDPTNRDDSVRALPSKMDEV